MRTIKKHLIIVSCLVLAGTMGGEYAVAGDNGNLSGPPSMRAVEVPDGPLAGKPPMPRGTSQGNEGGTKGYLKKLTPQMAPQQKLHLPAGNRVSSTQAFEPGKGGMSGQKRHMPRREKKLAPTGGMKMKKGNMAKGNSFVMPKGKDNKGKKDTSDRIIRRKGHLPPGTSVPKRPVPDFPRNPVSE